MSRLIIEGGRKLSGSVRVHGAKNAVLPILAASVLNGKKNIIHDCPRISDVDASIEILEYIGCKVSRFQNTLIVDSSGANRCSIPESMMRRMRSSIIFMGAFASRYRSGSVAIPGGCEIGQRPVDLHIKSFSEMGVIFSDAGGCINFEAPNLSGTAIHLSFPSVGATENIMLAAVFAKGRTIISNAAKEPEIEDLQNFLVSGGAKISGAGGDVIIIDGVDELSDIEYTVMPDRIVAQTYIACVMAAGGEIEIENARAHHMEAAIDIAEQMGANLSFSKNAMRILAPDRVRAVKMIRTMPYPGFPTDTQSPFMAALAISDGVSVFTENIFENRFKHVTELLRMGADITVDGRIAVVRGVRALSGAHTVASDLRGGAALAVAGLASEGITVIDNAEYIDRGYETFERSLALLGGNVKRE